MRNNGTAFFYLIFAIAFGGAGFGIFFGAMLPEIIAGQFDMIIPAFITLFVFGGVGVGMGIAFFKTVACGIRSRRILSFGTPGMGTYIDSRAGVTVNNTQYYKLIFSFSDNNGHEHIVKTRSVYFAREVDTLRSLGTFEIKWIGHHAVVEPRAYQRGRAVSHPQPAQARAPQATVAAVAPKKICKYCGGETDVEHHRCLYCGAGKFVFNTQPSVGATAPAFKANTAQKPQSLKGAKIIIGVVVTIMVLPFLFGIIFAIIGATGGLGFPPPTTKYHQAGNVVRTDWFTMTMVSAQWGPRLDPWAQYGYGEVGDLGLPPSGFRRVLVEVILDNHRYDEVLDMHLKTDFYFEVGGDKIHSINEGGGITYYDQHGLGAQVSATDTRKIFKGAFMVSCLGSLRGVIVYDFPEHYTHASYFVYEEWHFKGDTPVSVKTYHKFRW